MKRFLNITPEELCRLLTDGISAITGGQLFRLICDRSRRIMYGSRNGAFSDLYVTVMSLTPGRLLKFGVLRFSDQYLSDLL